MKNNDIKKFYDYVAEETAKNWKDNNILLPTIRDFLSYLPKKPKVFDLGCGTGHESMRLYSEGADVTGVDFSSKSVQIAKRDFPECSFIEMDFFDIDESFGLFDGIFSSGSLIHLPVSQMNVLIKKLSDLLKIHGYFMIIFQEGHKNLIHYPIINGVKTKREVYRFTKDQITNFFNNAEMSLVKESLLADELNKQSWKAYIFQKNRRRL